MKKRRVTLNLDEDVVEALESLGARSLSSAANDALRQAVATEAHRAALARWLDELDAAHGPAAPEDARAIDSLLDELAQPSTDAGVA
ncbi:MAG TPA: hypothetical protein VFA11_14765 [Acidimicrobiales bacterium]|nr:hypothetical protein [Acidimicrobiales bacterium]